jgi:hypothetical protein
MPRNKLIIFDYSGTLSLNAVLFGRPSHLMKELKISGLAALGIDTPEIFWRDIVNPTWRVGSTTSLGYKHIMETSLREMLSRTETTVSAAEIRASVFRFVDRYLHYGEIDSRWGAVLQSLSRHSGLRVIIEPRLIMPKRQPPLWASLRQ